MALKRKINCLCNIYSIKLAHARPTMHRIRVVYIIIIIVEVRMAVLLPALESFDVYWYEWEWLGTMLSKCTPYTHGHKKIF